MNYESRIMNILKLSNFILYSLFFILAFAPSANASTLYLLPEGKTFARGQEFSVDVKVDTSDVFINAVQSTVNFSNNILEVVSTDKNSSVFNFWIDEPEINNELGRVSFIGGTAKGVSGGALQIVRINFKVVGTGVANISFDESVVTANDGKGTNVLSEMAGTKIKIGAKTIEAEIPFVPQEVEKEELPQRVERVAVKAVDAPEAPVVRVPFYPEHGKWYNHQGNTIVLWDVPEDVIKVAVEVNAKVSSEPTTSEEELFTGKNIGVLSEGIHYVHVQFKNNKGWGEVTHYKIAIDTTSPLPFETQISSFVSDNPVPEIEFKTQDSLSGYSHALIFIDGKEAVESTDEFLLLPPQSPGEHDLVVRVFDKAGNSVEDDVKFEIIPLEKPVVDFITKKVSGGEFLFASGKAVPNGFVDVKILKDDQIIFTTFSESNKVGNWEVVIEEPFQGGEYKFLISSRDDRGGVSYNTEPISFKITAKTIISLGVVDFGWFEIVIILVLIFSSVGSFVAWYYVSEKEKRSAYKIIVGRDIKKLSKLMENDMEDLEKSLKKQKFKSEDKEMINNSLKGLKSTVVKMKKYLSKEIEKLK